MFGIVITKSLVNFIKLIHPILNEKQPKNTANAKIKLLSILYNILLTCFSSFIIFFFIKS